MFKDQNKGKEQAELLAQDRLHIAWHLIGSSAPTGALGKQRGPEEGTQGVKGEDEHQSGDMEEVG